MTPRMRTVGWIMLLVAGALVFSLGYGPLSRKFVTPPRCEVAESPAEIARLWTSSRVKGRVAVLFTRRLNGEVVGKEVETAVKYLEDAMQHGMVRTVYHVVPDTAWGEVAEKLSRMPGVRPIESGFAILFGAGRVHVLPLSRFAPIREKALVVVAPAEWTTEEFGVIANLIKQQRVSADLLTVLRGTDAELAGLRGALALSRQ